MCTVWNQESALIGVFRTFSQWQCCRVVIKMLKVFWIITDDKHVKSLWMLMGLLSFIKQKLTFSVNPTSVKHLNLLLKPNNFLRKYGARGTLNLIMRMSKQLVSPRPLSLFLFKGFYISSKITLPTTEEALTLTKWKNIRLI